MKRALIVAAALIGTSAFAANWQPATPGSQVYIEQDSVVRKRSAVTVLVRHPAVTDTRMLENVNLAPQFRTHDWMTRVETELLTYDCNKRLQSGIPVEPESWHEAVLKAVCRR